MVMSGYEAAAGIWKGMNSHKAAIKSLLSHFNKSLQQDNLSTKVH